MYPVKLINSGVETVINAVSARQDAPRITGTVKQGINCFNSFDFTIMPGNPGYDLVSPLKSKITVYNTKTKKYEFVGRVLTPKSSMDTSGVASREYVCESELAYLNDSHQRYGEYHNITPEQYLRLLIGVHNSNVEADKQFTVGIVTVTDPNNSIYRYSDYGTTWSNIKSDLIDTLGGELQVRYGDDGTRYLDYLASPGETKTTEIKLGRNMRSASEELDVSGLYTRIIPLGAKIKKTDSDGNEVETDERLTISSVNGGVDYLDYADGIAQYGIIEGTIPYDDVTTPEALLAKGQAYVNSLSVVLSNEISAYDLSSLGIDPDAFEVGNYYPVRNELLNISYTLRVIEKGIKIESPAENTLTFGKQQIDIKTYNALKSADTRQKLANAVTKIQEVQNSIGPTAQGKVDAYDKVLDQTKILNKLVKGDYQGLFLDDNGNLYMKGTYVATGILASTKLATGSTTEPVSWISLDDGAFSLAEGALKYDGKHFGITLPSGSFGESGIVVDRDGSKTKSVIDETKFEVLGKTGSANDTLIFVGVDADTGESVGKMKNLSVSKYLCVGANSRFEDYQGNRTGCFYVGS